jgi:hypothetical protein
LFDFDDISRYPDKAIVFFVEPRRGGLWIFDVCLLVVLMGIIHSQGFTAFLFKKKSGPGAGTGENAEKKPVPPRRDCQKGEKKSQIENHDSRTPSPKSRFPNHEPRRGDLFIVQNIQTQPSPVGAVDLFE